MEENYCKAGKSMARVPRTAREKISLARGIRCCSIFFSLAFARSASLIVTNVYVHI